MSINRTGKTISVAIMPNIPLIHQSRASTSPTPRRAGKVAASVHSTYNTPDVRRRLERRHNRDRRIKQAYVLIDRRQRGCIRRKSHKARAKTADSPAFSDNIGKHINTTA